MKTVRPWMLLAAADAAIAIWDKPDVRSQVATVDADCAPTTDGGDVLLPYFLSIAALVAPGMPDARLDIILAPQSYANGELQAFERRYE